MSTAKNVYMFTFVVNSNFKNIQIIDQIAWHGCCISDLNNQYTIVLSCNILTTGKKL